MNKESILNFDVCTLDKETLLQNIFKDYEENRQTFIVNINPEIIAANYSNIEFRNVLNEQKYQIPDGIGIVWASKRRKGNIRARITGIDLMNDICNKAQEYSANIYLYGAKDGVVEKTREMLKKAYPKINIVGTSNGYTEEQKVIENIKETNPDILFVGLGSPKQEEFIIKNKEDLRKVCILMPVGGSFDVISETKKRAPNWMIKCNIEWLYRLIKEPKRIFRQVNLIKFIMLVKKEEKKCKK